ncbi:MAG: hypothetical protein BWY24_00350 [Microgenomates group bacterium ADurb.Bin219]|nr:MAG: hypothetical protein BWY24_00350 [Microgenomates group bacterium ADurb.Bin219]
MEMAKKSVNLFLIFVIFALLFGVLYAPVLALDPVFLPQKEIKIVVPTATPTPTIPILKLKDSVFKIMPTVVANTATPIPPTPTTAISPTASGTPAISESVGEAVEPTEAVAAEPTKAQTAKTSLIGTKEAVFIATIALLLVIIVLQGRPKKETKEEGPTQ